LIEIIFRTNCARDLVFGHWNDEHCNEKRTNRTWSSCRHQYLTVE